MAATQRRQDRQGPAQDDQPHQQAFSVTVGRDSWAGQVIDNVVGSESEPPLTGPEDQLSVVASKIRQKKRLFHANRCLELKNLPDGVREEDIAAAFPDLEITSITIEKPDVRVKAGARLRLARPEVLDSWPVSRQVVFVCNKEVSVCVGSSEGWLCVARLPPDTGEEEFSLLVSSYGLVGESFLVASEVTGAGKGYGLVRYKCSQAAAQARHLLDNKTVRGFSVQVDWLSSTHISYSQLHSKCLYIDNLPTNYRDMTNFRNIFSVVKNPPYCQIAMKNGVIQDWGLVEFFDSNSAEVTQQKLNGHSLKGQKIRVHFCIPGVNAINIYMAVVNSKEETKKKAPLLEDAPSSSVYTQLQKLASQNPAFAQNLENIIETQIQNIRTGGSSSPTSGSYQEQNQRPTSSCSSVEAELINPNAQAALMILLTAQSQAAAGEMSLLCQPEVQEVLESLVCSEKTVQDPYSALTRSLGAEQGHSHSPPPVIANNMNMLSNTSSLNQLLGVISCQPSSTPRPPPAVTSTATSSAAGTPTPPTSQHQTVSGPSVRPSLMSVPPPPTSQHQQHHHQPQQHQQQQLQHHQQQQLIQHQQQLLQHQHQQLLAAQLAAVGQLQGNVYQQPVQPLMLAGPGAVPGLTCTGPPPAPFFVHPGSVQPLQPLQYANLPLLPMVPPNALDIQLPGMSSPISHSPVPRITASSPATSISTTPSPVSLKRKASIPPSPEASPLGPYIGQHSQGLGGHYADSYWAKKRLKQSF